MNPFKWLDERTGLMTALSTVTHWTVPASKCLCRFLPVAIVFAFILQGLTGLFLWAFYSPSAQTAWESVYYIQYHLPYGWLVRGIHHYSAQLLVGSLGIYVLLMILHGSYRRPREFVYWSAVVMFLFSLASCLTGDLLMWSLSGYFATIARVSFLQILPEIGVSLYKLVVGGPDPQFGTLTLTRFTVLHIAVFGGGFLVVMLFWKWCDIRSRNLNLMSKFKNQHVCALACAVHKRRAFWNCEAFLCALTCVVFMAAVLALVFQHSFNVTSRASTLPAESYLGAELTSPADPGSSYDAARPEWSFRALYYWSKLPIFSKIGMIYAIFVTPGLLLLYFFALPIVGRFRLFHWCIVLCTLALFGGFCYATYQSYWDDYKNPEHAPTFLASKAHADVLKQRAVELTFAPAGIPKTGALDLLKKDPFVQGPVIFEQQCSSCHRFEPFLGDAKENPDYKPIPCAEPTAPNLYDCVSADWIHGYQNLEAIQSDNYFGKTTSFAKNGSMVTYLKGRVVGGMFTEEDDENSDFILNTSNGLIYSLIAYDASPAFDILQASLEELVEENADSITPEGQHVALLKKIVERRLRNAEFIETLQPKLPVPVYSALQNVLLALFDDETYIDLLKDEDNIAMILDDDIDTFLEESFLLTLCGNDEPISADSMTYIKMLQQGLNDALRGIGNILYEESQLDELRPFYDGKYKGLREYALTDMEFMGCLECHAFYGKENDHACDLRGYMSRDWLKGIISDPSSVKYYGASNDRMPLYHPQNGDALMTESEIDILADWLHGNWYRAPEVENDTLLGSDNWYGRSFCEEIPAITASIEAEKTRSEQITARETERLVDAQKAAADLAQRQADAQAAAEKAEKERLDAEAKAKEAAAKHLAETEKARDDALALAEETKASSEKKIEETLTQTAQEVAQAHADAEKQIAEIQAAADQTANQAKADAENAVNQAQADAENAVNQAQADAEKAVSQAQADAEKAIADTKAEADQKISDLQAEMKTLSDESEKAISATKEESAQKVQDAQAAADKAVADAQAAAEQSVANAKTEADTLVSETQAAAEKSVADAKAEAEQVLTATRAEAEQSLNRVTDELNGKIADLSSKLDATLKEKQDLELKLAEALKALEEKENPPLPEPESSNQS